MQSQIFQRLKAVPAIVRIIIAQAARRRAEGGITEGFFAAQMGRLAAEELEPKGLTLLVRDLPGGHTRFIIKEKATGATCDMLEFGPDGTAEEEVSEQQGRESA